MVGKRLLDDRPTFKLYKLFRDGREDIVENIVIWADESHNRVWAMFRLTETVGCGE